MQSGGILFKKGAGRVVRILIVEDEKPISDLIQMSLSGEGYACTCAYDGLEAADLLERESFDLALLDIMLPRADGYELLEYVKHYDLPVIFLTAMGGVADRVRGLRAGAEDYIVKPFEIAELLARVQAVLRRVRRGEKVLSFGEVTVDLDARVAKKGGEPVSLTAKEFDVLAYLAQNPNKALYRTQIYARVWGSDELGDSRTVDLHVQRLRKKLGLERVLVPVYKIGYRLEVEK